MLMSGVRGHNGQTSWIVGGKRKATATQTITCYNQDIRIAPLNTLLLGVAPHKVAIENIVRLKKKALNLKNHNTF